MCVKQPMQVNPTTYEAPVVDVCLCACMADVYVFGCIILSETDLDTV